MLKTIIGMVIGLTIVGAILFLEPDTETYERPQTATSTVEVVEVDRIEARIKEAQDAAMAEIEAEANQMRDAFIENELKTIEAETLAEIEAELKSRRIEREKETGAYWRDRENVKAFIRATFPEDPHTAVQVAQMESELRMVQSNHVYTASNVPKGYSVGDREESFCIFQIHKPAHHHTAVRLGLEDYATNIESCVKMARIVYEDRGNSFSAWSVYKTILALR